MSVLRTLVVSFVIVAAGIVTLLVATDDFRAFTTETARRIAVADHPRPLPAATLQTAQGQDLHLASLRGRWLLVDFIYTNCDTYCGVQGNEFSQLQEKLARPIAKGEVQLLSISFDPTRDDPAALAAYQKRSGDRGGAGWIAARPVDTTDLAALMRTFGIKAVPDGRGGFVHNSAINVVDPEGRLVDIVDWDNPQRALKYVSDRLAADNRLSP